MLSKALFSSDRGDWETPPELFAELDKEFGFVLDAAADGANAKCKQFIDKAVDAFSLSWQCDQGAVWLNPEYGRGIGAWVAKAWETSREGTRVVCLLPARTCTKWWHRYVWNGNRPHDDVEVRFLQGRLTFVGAPAPAPFPSVVVIFHPPGGQK